jgi:hypothetical protein
MSRVSTVSRPSVHRDGAMTQQQWGEGDRLEAELDASDHEPNLGWMFAIAQLARSNPRNFN